MNYLELAKVKAFYYAKVVELSEHVLARKLLQRKHEGEWVDLFGFICDINWKELGECRIKPETIQHPGGEMPKPLSVDEAENADYIYVPQVNSQGVSYTSYGNLSVKIGHAKRGHAYATEQDAIAAGHVMFNIPKGE